MALRHRTGEVPCDLGRLSVLSRTPRLVRDLTFISGSMTCWWPGDTDMVLGHLQ